MLRARPAIGLLLVLIVLASTVRIASAADPERIIRFHFSPTARAQIALWIERDNGTYMRTVVLTQAVARRGIGNRPGATLMNSGFRWPYGRREGVLPVWGHHRAESTGRPFERVIFNGRTSEGLASVSGGEPRNTPDMYYCLSFDLERSRRDALDAVSCASVFNSNKGRYLTEGDSSNGYGEPFEEPDGSSFMRPLGVGSIYPSRRDVTPCTGSGCGDHADVARYIDDTRTVMPEIDAVTTATYMAMEHEVPFTAPSDWPDGDYVAYLEINVEGDYNGSYNDTTHPTPRLPEGRWDYWAINYGYPYRGQPSVVYRVPFRLSSAGGNFSAATPSGFGSLDGRDGELHEMNSSITDDPTAAPGSGADRLHHLAGGSRFTVEVIPTSVCAGEDPPPICGTSCRPGDPVPDGFICDTTQVIGGTTGVVTGVCDADLSPGEIGTMMLETHPDEKQSHHWARVEFVVPESMRPISQYDVRVGTEPIVDEASFMRAAPANAASLDSVQLVVPTEGNPGELVQVDFGGLNPETTYYVGIRAVDRCNGAGPITTRDVKTTPIHFTTVSPCFVATAAYGTPMAEEIGALRRFRDRQLLSHPLGRAFVSVYGVVGPEAAAVIRENETLRSVTRMVLEPIVTLAELVD